jgi:septal ring-binding cell division protein DamX
VRNVVESGGTLEEARSITIESCGLQRVLLNGMVTQLHTANVVALYRRLQAQQPPVRLTAARKVIDAEAETMPERKPRTARKTAAKKKVAKKKPARKTTTTTGTKRNAATKRRTS